MKCSYSLMELAALFFLLIPVSELCANPPNERIEIEVSGDEYLVTNGYKYWEKSGIDLKIEGDTVVFSYKSAYTSYSSMIGIYRDGSLEPEETLFLNGPGVIPGDVIDAFITAYTLTEHAVDKFVAWYIETPYFTGEAEKSQVKYRLKGRGRYFFRVRTGREFFDLQTSSISSGLYDELAEQAHSMNAARLFLNNILPLLLSRVEGIIPETTFNKISNCAYQPENLYKLGEFITGIISDAANNANLGKQASAADYAKLMFYSAPQLLYGIAGNKELCISEVIKACEGEIHKLKILIDETKEDDWRKMTKAIDRNTLRNMEDELAIAEWKKAENQAGKFGKAKNYADKMMKLGGIWAKKFSKVFTAFPDLAMAITKLTIETGEWWVSSGNPFSSYYPLRLDSCIFYEPGHTNHKGSAKRTIYKCCEPEFNGMAEHTGKKSSSLKPDHSEVLEYYSYAVQVEDFCICNENSKVIWNDGIDKSTLTTLDTYEIMDRLGSGSTNRIYSDAMNGGNPAWVTHPSLSKERVKVRDPVFPDRSFEYLLYPEVTYNVFAIIEEGYGRLCPKGYWPINTNNIADIYRKILEQRSWVQYFDPANQGLYLNFEPVRYVLNTFQSTHHRDKDINQSYFPFVAEWESPNYMAIMEPLFLEKTQFHNWYWVEDKEYFYTECFSIIPVNGFYSIEAINNGINNLGYTRLLNDFIGNAQSWRGKSNLVGAKVAGFGYTVPCRCVKRMGNSTIQ